MQGAQGNYLFVVKPDNTAERRVVEVEATEGGIAVISKGLSVGEKIVIDGQYRLTNGSSVRIDQPTVKSAPPAAAAGKSG